MSWHKLIQTKTALDAGEEAHWNETLTWPDISESHTTLKLEVWEDDELKEVHAGKAEGIWCMDLVYGLERG